MNDIYKTRDLAESAALLVNNLRLVEIERVGKICWFYFENAERCIEISKEYYFGNLLVNAMDFHQAITRLKNRIFSNA